MYKEVRLTYQSTIPDFSGIIVAMLSEIGFDMFTEEQNTVNAYINADVYNEKMVAEVFETLKKIECNLEINILNIEEINWNEAWEKSFNPIEIKNKCLIKANFHGELSYESTYPYVITIQPKMAFGTGHHETTRMMIEGMFKLSFENTIVADIGCGSGILGILALKMKAKHVTFVDIDTWAVENTNENIKLNNTFSNYSIYLGNINKIIDKKFDIVLANITKNSIVQEIPDYLNITTKNGYILHSGFYEDDIPDILKAYNQQVNIIYTFTENQWTCIVLQKK